LSTENRCPHCDRELDVAQDASRARCPHCGAEIDAATIGRTALLGGESSQRVAESSRARPATPPVPKEFGRYRIEEHIARGGMGVVYRAFDPKLNRSVALKILIGAEHSSAEEIQRFFREAESAARLQHPNIVPIHELDVHEGRHYYTMEYIEGRPLDVLIREKALQVRPAMQLMEKVARAVAYAHSRGVIHRDLKPANILVDASGEPRVTDFGLAKILSAEGQGGSEERLTRTGAAMGTPQYMAPEQAAGRSKEVDARADVYALGCILYEMLTGAPPFTGTTAMETLQQHVSKMPEPPGRRGARVAADAETICLKCLEKEPGRRYASAGELADDIARFLDGEPITARRASFLYLVRRKVAHHRGAAAVAAAALVALAALGFWAHSRISGEKERLATLKSEQRGKADEACQLGIKALHYPGFSETEREAKLIEAKGHFLEALSLVPDHLEALEGMRDATTAHYRILERRYRDMPMIGRDPDPLKNWEASKRRNAVRDQMFAELRVARKYGDLYAAELKKQKPAGGK
jgi:hypothetical protein